MNGVQTSMTMTKGLRACRGMGTCRYLFCLGRGLEKRWKRGSGAEKCRFPNATAGYAKASDYSHTMSVRTTITVDMYNNNDKRRMEEAEEEYSLQVRPSIKNSKPSCSTSAPPYSTASSNV